MSDVVEPSSRHRPITLWCVLLASVAHVIRQKPFDLVVFLGVAMLIVIDDRRGVRAPMPSALPLPVWLSGLLCAAYAFLILPLDPGGAWMRAVVAVPGLVALVLVLRHGRTADRPPPLPRASWLPWAVLLVVLSLFQAFNFTHDPKPGVGSFVHPTLSSLIDPLLDASVPRAVAAGLWLAGGLWLMGRVVATSRKGAR